VGPNWFATVMGTSIVATAAVDLPVQVPGQRVFAQVVWVLAGLLLTAVGAATVGHWVRFPDRARRLAADPVMAHFYGAVPMALLAFGAATLAVGVDLIGAGAAVGVDWVLWLLGTVLGLACAVAVPYLVFTRHDVPEDGASGGWLMSVVPPSPALPPWRSPQGPTCSASPRPSSSSDCWPPGSPWPPVPPTAPGLENSSDEHRC
jgi:tellurite resistance protein TehA-like permease